MDRDVSEDHELMDSWPGQMRLRGVDATGAFAYDLDLSVPFLAVAIHAGHRVRPELLALMSISEQGRLFEEDAATDLMIRHCPNAVWALDSRAEYDLNRPVESALPLTPERFWGIQVYQRQPTPDMINACLEKYRAFYRFVSNCTRILLERFGACLIYDIHSYNRTRQIEKGIDPPPVFNLGTELLEKTQWSGQIGHWLHLLSDIEIPGCRTTVAENQVFSGRGEFCRRMTAEHARILVLPTEISKIYMDEREGVVYPAVVDALGKGLQQAVTQQARYFLQEVCA